MDSKKIKSVVSSNSIILKYEGKIITVQKSQNELVYLELLDLIKNQDDESLIEQFISIKAKMEKYTNGVFKVKEGKMYLKGDDVPMPKLMVDKLLELEDNKEDFMPLIRFWKKLKQNPSQASIEQLYGFMVHNGIGITDLGDIVVEKGVSPKRGGAVGELVDTHSKTVDNSIGATVEMDRDKVDDNPEQTCSVGLHVGAPQYVRQFYRSGILIRCTVNPKDVVAVPVDYNNTKMRVCKYKVVGYSDKSEKPVYRLEDFVQKPDEEFVTKMEKASKESPDVPRENKDAVKSSVCDSTKEADEHIEDLTVYQEMAEEAIEGKTAKEIVDFVNTEADYEITFSLKSKKSIVKKAIDVLTQHYEAQ